MKVLIIGAGIGGLTLAHALRGAGVDVRVHERDAQPADTGGYRLHLDSVAAEVLGRRLPPALYQALLASAADPDSFRRFGVLDHRMRLLLSLPRDEPGDALLIGRIPLRRLLCEGLDEVIRFGAEFTRAETHHDGTVTAHFADHSSDHGDLLVGADGSHSRVTAALAGRPTSQPLDATALAGRTPLTPHTRPLLPAPLHQGPAFAFGPGGVGMFLSIHDPTAGAAIDPATCHEVPAQLEPGYLLWGIHLGDEPDARDGLQPARTDHAGAEADGDDQQTAALGLLIGWSSQLRSLVAAADPASITRYRLRAADPDADLTPWSSGTTTAIGDAVHAMPPTGGRGAATAIHDADLLASQLTAARDGATTLPLAVHTYEHGMARYAPDAVRASLSPLHWQQRLRGPIAFHVGRAVLPALTRSFVAARERRCPLEYSADDAAAHPSPRPNVC